MSNIPSKQHVVPKIYQKSWVGIHKNSVYKFDKNNLSAVIIANIDNNFKSKHVNTIDINKYGFLSTERLNELFLGLCGYQINGRLISNTPYEDLQKMGILPDSFLKNIETFDFTDNKGQRINNKDRRRFRQKITNIKHVEIENFFNDAFETHWENCLVKIKNFVRTGDKAICTSITTELLDFMLAQFIRNLQNNCYTSKIIEKIAEMIQGFIPIKLDKSEMIDTFRIYKSLDLMVEYYKNSNQSNSFADYFNYLNPLTIENYRKIFKNNIWVFLNAPMQIPFITSDNPINFTGNSKGEIFFPITPSICLLLTKKYVAKQENSIIFIKRVDEDYVKQVNTFIVSQSKNAVISNTQLLSNIAYI